MEAVSSKALQDTKVTGFVSDCRATFIYGCSLTWIFVLLFIEGVFLTSDTFSEETDFLLVSSMVLNSIVLVAQTVDYVRFHFLFWPVTAINWCAQLSVLGTASSLLSYTVFHTSPDDTETRRAIALVHLVSQALFTASQFAVTLEYFERRVTQFPLYQGPTPQPRRTTSGRV